MRSSEPEASAAINLIAVRTTQVLDQPVSCVFGQSDPETDLMIATRPSAGNFQVCRGVRASVGRASSGALAIANTAEINAANKPHTTSLRRTPTLPGVPARGDRERWRARMPDSHGTRS